MSGVDQLPRPLPWPFVSTLSIVSVATFEHPCSVYKVHTLSDHPAILRIGTKHIYVKCKPEYANIVQAKVENRELDPVLPTHSEPCGDQTSVTLDLDRDRVTIYSTRVVATSPDACTIGTRLVSSARRDREEAKTVATVQSAYTYEFVFDHCYVRDFFTRINKLPNVTISRTDSMFRICLGEQGEMHGDMYGAYDYARPVDERSRMFVCDAAVAINTLRVTTTTDRPAPLLGESLSQLVAYSLFIHPPAAVLASPAARASLRWTQIRRAVPSIYPIGFPRLVQKQRIMVPLPLEMYDPSSPSQVVFPPCGPLQCVFECVHPDFPVAGFVVNTCWNAHIFPLLPAAFKSRGDRLRTCVPMPPPVPSRVEWLHPNVARVVLGVPLVDAVARARGHALPPSILPGLAELCVQSCYDEPVECVRQRLDCGSGLYDVDPERHWRAIEHAFGCRLVVIDATTRQPLGKRSAFVYIHNRAEFNRDAPSACLLRVSDRCYDILDNFEPCIVALQQCYGQPAMDPMTIPSSIELPGVQEGAPVLQRVDAYGRVREMVLDTGTTVEGLMMDTVAHVPVARLPEPWVHMPPVAPTPAMLLNRTAEWLAKFEATRDFVDLASNTANVRIKLRTKLPVVTSDQPRWDAQGMAYCIATRGAALVVRNPAKTQGGANKNENI